MKARLLSGIFAWLLLISGGVLSDPSTGTLATDNWSVVAAEARRIGTSVIVLFSDEHCGYCERLKKEVLEPLGKCSEFRDFGRIWEINLNRGGKITDFDGEKIRSRLFIKRYGIYATPTLILVDYQGNPLGTPIVGFNNRYDYIPYLDHLFDVNDRELPNLQLPCNEHIAAASK